MSNYYMGIVDVSKGYADFCILNMDKKPQNTSFQLDDTSAGHETLCTYFKDFFARYPDATLFAAVESTGGYKDNWHHRLQDCAQSIPIHFARINPAWIKFNSQASDKRNKTDKISSKDVAEYQIEHP